MNGLEGNGYQRHLSLYNKGICAAQGNGGFSADLRMASSAVSCVTNIANCHMQNAVILSSDYLAVPNNLLLSLSLSLS